MLYHYFLSLFLNKLINLLYLRREINLNFLKIFILEWKKQMKKKIQNN